MTDRRVALVTGGSSGIGLQCGRRLIDDGYDVVLTARTPDRLERAAQEIGARCHPADCADPAQVTELLGLLERVDLLVHSAGMLAGSNVGSQGLDTWDEVVRVNLRGAYVVAASVLPLMDPGGRMIFVSSTAAKRGWPGLSAYSASKAGMTALAEALAAEVEERGIAVHLVTPAPVDTPMLAGAAGAETFMLAPDDVADAVVWLQSLHPRVVVREVVMRAVMKGPFALASASTITQGGSDAD